MPGERRAGPGWSGSRGGARGWMVLAAGCAKERPVNKNKLNWGEKGWRGVYRWDDGGSCPEEALRGLFVAWRTR